MNEFENKIEPEILASPELIDGRAWLRQIFRESKPRLLYRLEAEARLEEIRQAITSMEVAFLNNEEEKIPDEIFIANTINQKRQDIEKICPTLAAKYNNERSQNERD